MQYVDSRINCYFEIYDSLNHFNFNLKKNNKQRVYSERQHTIYMKIDVPELNVSRITQPPSNLARKMSRFTLHLLN